LGFAGAANAGDVFRIIWFDPDGVNAGTLSDGSFVLPPDGAIVSRTAPFLGFDGVKSAFGTTFTVVPEPSVSLLGAFGVMILLRRRR
jgi:hypothetical protein